MADFPGKTDHNAPDSPESQLVGGPVQRNKEQAERANPIRYVTKNAPPFFIVHGENDPLVPPNQSELLHAALLKAGVPVTFRIIPGGGHGGPGFGGPDMRLAVREFFDKHLRQTDVRQIGGLR